MQGICMFSLLLRNCVCVCVCVVFGFYFFFYWGLSAFAYRDGLRSTRRRQVHSMWGGGAMCVLRSRGGWTGGFLDLRGKPRRQRRLFVVFDVQELWAVSSIDTCPFFERHVGVLAHFCYSPIPSICFVCFAWAAGILRNVWLPHGEHKEEYWLQQSTACRSSSFGSWPTVGYFPACNVGDMLAGCGMQEAQSMEGVNCCLSEIRVRVCCVRIFQDSTGSKYEHCCLPVRLPNARPPSLWEHYVAFVALLICWFICLTLVFSSFPIAEILVLVAMHIRNVADQHMCAHSALISFNPICVFSHVCPYVPQMHRYLAMYNWCGHIVSSSCVCPFPALTSRATAAFHSNFVKPPPHGLLIFLLPHVWSMYLGNSVHDFIATTTTTGTMVLHWLAVALDWHWILFSLPLTMGMFVFATCIVCASLLACTLHNHFTGPLDAPCKFFWMLLQIVC